MKPQNRIALAVFLFFLLEFLGITVLFASGPWSRDFASAGIVTGTHLIALVSAVVCAGWDHIKKV